jgi:hypothetical protein
LKGRANSPWTLAGGADLTCGEADRSQVVRLLTDPGLAGNFQHAYRKVQPSDYDTMIRVLDLVWDCPDDGTVNVVGYLCAGCFGSRAQLELAARCRDGR